VTSTALALVDEPAEPNTHEWQLIESALLMVASGASPRVVLAGLRRAELVLPFAQQRADEVGVVARAIWGEHGCDIAVEPYE
jgi:hypothetical protein